MGERREFIGTYEHMGGKTFSIDVQWAIQGEAEEIIRCRNCVNFNDSMGIGWCDSTQCGTPENGFCHRGEMR